MKLGYTILNVVDPNIVGFTFSDYYSIIVSRKPGVRYFIRFDGRTFSCVHISKDMLRKRSLARVCKARCAPKHMTVRTIILESFDDAISHDRKVFGRLLNRGQLPISAPTEKHSELYRTLYNGLNVYEKHKHTSTVLEVVVKRAKAIID